MQLLQLGNSECQIRYSYSCCLETNLWCFSQTCPCIHSVLGGDTIIYLVILTRKLKIILDFFLPIITFPRHLKRLQNSICFTNFAVTAYVSGQGLPGPCATLSSCSAVSLAPHTVPFREASEWRAILKHTVYTRLSLSFFWSVWMQRNPQSLQMSK